MIPRDFAFVLMLVLGPVGPGEVAADSMPEVLVSRQLLEARDLSVGGTIALSADPAGSAPRSFRVVGSYEPIPDPMLINADRYEVRLHLPDLLEMTADPDDPGDGESVDSINVALRDPEDAVAFARDLQAKMPGLLAVPTTAANGADPFVVLERFHLAIALVAVIASTAFLLALMVMRAEERRETVGILRLIGLSKPGILLEVFIEGLMIAVAGAVFGVLMAAASQGLLNVFFQWHYDTPLVFVRVTWGIAWRCIALAIPLGVFAGLVASWTLLRREILSLIRR